MQFTFYAAAIALVATCCLSAPTAMFEVASTSSVASKVNHQHQNDGEQDDDSSVQGNNVKGGKGDIYTGIPLKRFTPGKLCTPDDPNYMGEQYGISKCKRNVPQSEKSQVSTPYGAADKDTWPEYEFDHLIPLGIGGSDDPENIWPQFRGDVQKDKDRIENDAYLQLSRGEISQKESIQMIWDFVNENYKLRGSERYTCLTVSCFN